MKNLLHGFMLFLIATSAIAQTATDFTANDCNGNPHHLFSELDSGKIIVLCWVMPCGSCTGPALTTYNVVQSYQASYPGRVFYYLADDYANTTCTSINSWANSSGIAQSAWSLRFSNAAIKMTDYGANAMPKIVVLGSSNHTVFLTADNVIDSESLQNAIEAAMAAVGIEETNTPVFGLSVSPNPSQNIAELTFSLSTPAVLTLEIYDVFGRKLEGKSLGVCEAAAHRIQFSVANYESGMYIIKLGNNGASSYMNFIVQH